MSFVKKKTITQSFTVSTNDRISITLWIDLAMREIKNLTSILSIFSKQENSKYEQKNVPKYSNDKPITWNTK